MQAYTPYLNRGMGDTSLSPSGDTYVNDVGTNAYGDTIVESPASTGYTSSPDAYAALMNAIQNLGTRPSASGISGFNPVYVVIGVILLAAVFGGKR